MQSVQLSSYESDGILVNFRKNLEVTPLETIWQDRLPAKYLNQSNFLLPMYEIVKPKAAG